MAPRPKCSCRWRPDACRRHNRGNDLSVSVPNLGSSSNPSVDPLRRSASPDADLADENSASAEDLIDVTIPVVSSTAAKPPRETKVLGIKKRKALSRAIQLGAKLKKCEAELKESERNLRELVDQLSDAEFRIEISLNESSGLRDRCASLDRQVLSLNSQIEIQQSSLTELMEQISQCKQRETDAHLTRLREISEMESSFSQANSEQERLFSQQISRLSSERDDLLSKVSTYKRMADGLQQELLRKGHSSDLVRCELESVRTENELLSNNSVKLKKELDSLKDKTQHLLVDCKKPFEQVGPKGQRNRVKAVKNVVDELLVHENQTERNNESSQLFEALFKQHPSLYEGVLVNKMSPMEDIVFCERFGVGQNKRRQMKKWLIERNLDILAPNCKVDDQRKNLSVSQFFKFELFDVNDNGKLCQVPGVCTANLQELLTARVERLARSGKLKLGGEFAGRLFCCILGDKGGDTTKLGLLIANVDNANSFSNVSLLSIYKGPDSLPYLHEVLHGIADQFNQLSSVRVEVDGVVQDIPIEKFLTGDMLFMCAAYGHAGPNSTYCCLICETTGVPLSQLNNTFTDRTLSSMKSQALLSGDAAKGMRACPLFNIPVTNIVPSALHIFMGIANDLLEKVEMLCLAEDCVGITDVEIRKRSDALTAKKSIEKVISDQRNRLKSFEALQKNALVVLEVMVATLTKSIVPNDVDEAKCSANCLFVDKRINQLSGDSLEWIQCEQEICEKWFHMVCAGLVDSNDIAAAKDLFVCYLCEGKSLNDLKSEVEDYLVLVDEKISELQDSLRECEGKLLTLRNAVDHHLGACYRRYQDQLARMGIRQAVYFQKLNGNQIRKLLTNGNPQLLTSIFTQQTQEVSDVTKALVTLGEIQSFTEARFFSNEEIDHFQSLVIEFKSVLTRVYAKDTTRNREKKITPKTHWLLAHVLPFLRRFKTWGLMSEQGGEAMHCKVNEMERRLFCISKNVERKLMQIVELMNIQNMIHDGILDGV